MDARTREFVRDELLKKAAQDAEFRADLLRDPRSAVKAAFGMDPPEDVELLVMEETPTRLYVVLPPQKPGKSAQVSLREVTETSVRAVCNLKVKPEQEGFVAPNSISIAEAHFNPKAWFRAIYADETPVGFVMLLDDPETPRYYLWRYMVDAEYQGHGFGRQALEEVITYVRTRPGATVMELSYVPGEGSPAEFYRKLGFQDTGESHGGENVMRLDLSR
jgi:diamine N-acetyltransferase